MLILLVLMPLGAIPLYAQQISVKLPMGEKEVFERSQNQFNEGDYQPAKEGFSQLLSLYPREIYFNYAYGACLVNLNTEFDKSIQYLEYALKGGNYHANYYLGLAYHLHYMFEKAIIYYEAFQAQAFSKEMRQFPVARQLRMAYNGVSLIRYAYDLQVVKNKKVKTQNFHYSYDIPHSGGEIVVVPEEFRSKTDKKKKHKGLMYVSYVHNRAFYASYGNSKDASLDIYMVTKEGDKWSAPILLPAQINTSEDEDFPFFHPDGEKMYFSSKGHNSMGGYDIFVVQYDRHLNSWYEAKNLDFPINTPLDDIMYITDSYNITAYFASNRETESGRIGVYQILLEKDPPLRLVENMDDIRKTSKLDITPLAMQIFEKRMEDAMPVNTDTITADSLLVVVPDESNGFQRDSVVFASFENIVMETYESIDELNNSIENYRNKENLALAKIDFYISKIEDIEEEKKTVERMKIQAYEKEAKLRELDEKQYRYIDSIAMAKYVYDEYEKTIVNLEAKATNYKSTADDVVSNKDVTESGNNTLREVTKNIDNEIALNTDYKITEQNRSAYEESRKAIEKNETALNQMKSDIERIDNEILQCYNGIKNTDNYEDQQKLNQRIASLEKERNSIVKDYKELYLKQEFLFVENQQLQTDLNVTQALIAETDSLVPSYRPEKVDALLANANRYIMRRNQKNLKEMADVQMQILDSVFFDNSQLITKQFDEENNEVVKQISADKTSLEQITLIAENPILSDIDIDNNLKEARQIVSTMDSINKQLQDESDVIVRKKLLDDYAMQQQSLDSVYSEINQNIAALNNTISVTVYKTSDNTPVRSHTEEKITAIKESGNEKEVLLAEDYLNTADSLYAMAAGNTENNELLPAVQDFYLKQAITYENKAFEIVEQLSADPLALLQDNQTDSITTSNQNRQIQEDETQVSDSIIRYTTVGNTKDKLNELTANNNDAEADKAWQVAVEEYSRVDELHSKAEKAKNESKKAEAIDEANQAYLNARKNHAQAALNDIDVKSDEYAIIEKGYADIAGTQYSDEQKNTAEALKTEAEQLHNQAVQLMLAAEETNNDSLRNELLIAAADFENKAVDTYRNAFEIISGEELPVNETIAQNNRVISNSTINDVAENHRSVILEQNNAQTEDTDAEQKAYTDMRKRNLERVDSLLVETENFNNQIASLETEYANTESPTVKDSIIKEIVHIQNKRLDANEKAIAIIADMQDEEIRRNREAIDSNKKLYRSNKDLLVEIDNEFKKYENIRSQMRNRNDNTYIYMLSEVVILGENLLEKQKRLLASAGNEPSTEQSDELTQYRNKIENTQVGIAKTTQWITEQQAIAMQNNSDSVYVVTNTDSLLVHKKTKAEIQYENSLEELNNLAKNDVFVTEAVLSITRETDSLVAQAKQIRNDIELNKATYSDMKLRQMEQEADSLVMLASKRHEAFIEDYSDYLAYIEQQQRLNDEYLQRKKKVEQTQVGDSSAAAVQRIAVVSDELLHAADSLDLEIAENYYSYNSDEISRLKMESAQLREKAIALYQQAEEIALNNNDALAHEINSEYQHINVASETSSDTLRLTAVNDTIIDNKVLPRYQITVDFLPDETQENSEYNKFLKQRDKSLHKHEKLSDRIEVLERTKTEIVNEKKIARINKKIDKIDAKRDDNLIGYYESNEYIAELQRRHLDNTYDTAEIIYYENRIIADSLYQTAIEADNTSELLRQQAETEKNKKQRRQLLEEAAKAEEQALKNRQEAIAAATASTRIRPVEISSDTALIVVNTDTVSNRQDIQAQNNDPVIHPVQSGDTIKLQPDYSNYEGLIFRIQFAAYNRIVGDDYTKGLSPIFTENVPGKTLIRYMTGVFGTYNAATTALPKVKALGFGDAFIVAYLNGVRVSIYEANQYLARHQASDVNLLVIGNDIIADNAGTYQKTVDRNTESDSHTSTQSAITSQNNDDTSYKNINSNAEVILTVQFAAAKRLLQPGEIYGIETDFVEYLDNGYIRHMYGKHYTMNDANAARNQLREKGARDAFVVAYRDGKRIPVNEALEIIRTKPVKKQVETNAQPIDTIMHDQGTAPHLPDKTSGIVIDIYVQVGAYRQEVSDETLELFANIADGNQIKTFSNNNLIIYRIGPLESKAKAGIIRQRAIQAGITDAFIVAYKDGKQIPLQQLTE